MNDEDWDDPQFNWIKAMPNTLDIQFQWFQEELERMPLDCCNPVAIETWNAAINQRNKFEETYRQADLMKNWIGIRWRLDA